MGWLQRIHGPIAGGSMASTAYNGRRQRHRAGPLTPNILLASLGWSFLIAAGPLPARLLRVVRSAIRRPILVATG